MARLIDGHSKDVIEDLAELAMKLSQNKETRKDFIHAVKKVDPHRRFPSQEVEDLRADMAAEREREKEERKLEEERRETEQRLTAQRRGLVTRGYSEDQIKEVEAVMTKYGITDYEAGADLYQARRPATPPAEQTGTWDIPGIDGTPMAELLTDPTKAARNEAYKVITEIKRGRAA
jgi:hypothetical protein